MLSSVAARCNTWLHRWTSVIKHNVYCIYINIHCVQKKTPTYVFDYNSGVSWSIFIIFVPVEREMNTLQFTYLQSWWRHNCVTLHATKVYFIELLLNIKYIEFWIEFEDKILIKNLWKCKRFSTRRLTKNSVQKNKKDEHKMAFCETCKQRVRSNPLHEAVGHGLLKMWCFYVR